MYSFIRSVSESEESEESELEGIECALQRGFVMADPCCVQSTIEIEINQCLLSVISLIRGGPRRILLDPPAAVAAACSRFDCKFTYSSMHARRIQCMRAEF